MIIVNVTVLSMSHVCELLLNKVHTFHTGLTDTYSILFVHIRKVKTEFNLKQNDKRFFLQNLKVILFKMQTLFVNLYTCESNDSFSFCALFPLLT